MMRYLSKLKIILMLMPIFGERKELLFSSIISFFSKEKTGSIAEYRQRFASLSESVFFDAIDKYKKNCESSVVSSYILGINCYLILDSSANPYINWLASEVVTSRDHDDEQTVRAEIDTALDTIMLRAIEEKLPSETNPLDCFPDDEKIMKEIAAMYQNIIANLFKDSISKEIILEAMQEAQSGAKRRIDKMGIKHRFLNWKERDKANVQSSLMIPMLENAEVDYANLERDTWITAGVKHNETYFEIFNAAITKAVERIIVESN